MELAIEMVDAGARWRGLFIGWPWRLPRRPIFSPPSDLFFMRMCSIVGLLLLPMLVQTRPGEARTKVWPWRRQRSTSRVWQPGGERREEEGEHARLQSFVGSMASLILIRLGTERGSRVGTEVDDAVFTSPAR